MDSSPRFSHPQTVADYYAALRDSIKERNDILLESHGRLDYSVEGKSLSYDVLMLSSKPIGNSAPIVFIRAGIHGDEISGPLSILKYTNELFNLAHERGCELIVLPLDNPSGFDAKTRYNIEWKPDSLEFGNNDFLRYTLPDGSFTDDTAEDTHSLPWVLSSECQTREKTQQQTVEARLLQKKIQQLPIERIAAVLDLHQDNSIEQEGAYHYAFYPEGDSTSYDHILSLVEMELPILKNFEIKAGQKSGITSDSRGTVLAHDGSLTDYLHRLGVKHSITVETTGASPLESAIEVNWIWMREIIRKVVTVTTF